ncbi:hypothetical protein TpMuguga_01g00625 [Theileria parva strain Muguga]|uniref:uncharacterized protein n=1 Tax=Theileria parva strain Muguga TaxID=333668 RepID=UPI001C61EB72|nr:uncharacterized protein TpMuguga_01g00625 [Theileria parva strain Muguga]EAN33863.2 hypothetical protein TpMuguga_01g00625 [Theileria parva strain Muguga]
MRITSSIILLINFVNGLAPLLEVNQPPYTLINVNLEHNSNIDSISRMGVDERNSKQINFNIYQEEKNEELEEKYKKLKKNQEDLYNKIILQ